MSFFAHLLLLLLLFLLACSSVIPPRWQTQGKEAEMPSPSLVGGPVRKGVTRFVRSVCRLLHHPPWGAIVVAVAARRLLSLGRSKEQGGALLSSVDSMSRVPAACRASANHGRSDKVMGLWHFTRFDLRVGKQQRSVGR